MNQVVVTGMGVVTPIGIDVDTFWRNAVAGQSGVRLEDRFELTGLPCGRVSGHVAPEDAGRLRVRGDPSARWGDLMLADAMEQALAQANLPAKLLSPAAVVLCELGGPASMELSSFAPAGGGDPAAVPRRASGPASSTMGAVFSKVARRFGRPVLPLTFEATCATGARLIAEGARRIQLGDVEVAVAAVVSSRLTPYTFGTYSQFGALTCWQGHPQQASKPFDRRRDGMVLAEAAGCMILESEAHAARRGACALARLAGWGFASGGIHPTAPEERLIETALRKAIAHGGLRPEDIDVVNTHGTSTRLNDQNEARALHAIFGERVAGMGFAACKSVLGHASVAAGLVESVVAVMTLKTGIVTPVPTCLEPDPACNLPVRREAVTLPVRAVLKNAFGFGGQYGALVFTRG